MNNWQSEEKCSDNNSAHFGIMPKIYGFPVIIFHNLQEFPVNLMIGVTSATMSSFKGSLDLQNKLQIFVTQIETEAVYPKMFQCFFSTFPPYLGGIKSPGYWETICQDFACAFRTDWRRKLKRLYSVGKREVKWLRF